MSEQHWVFGIHAVEALLQRQPNRIEELWLQQGRNDQRMQAIQDHAEQLGIRCKTVNRDELDKQVEGNHQGVLAQTKPAQTLRERDLKELLDGLDHPPLLLILDGVTDPHNLGACLRTADAAGVDAVIAPKDNSAPLNATVRKVACGAAEVMPFIQVTNLARTMKDIQERGIWISGTAGEAEQSVYEANLTGPIALVMGAEGKGMRRLTRENCDYLIKLPMAGSVSSLNVSVATGICLFEAVRQRG
ncbi:23S rRNA (guanosine(2251)-2'-O)-methyltransferase RlmB [Oceanicoccus sp. KOV_DT_Chl]|uniref:23S rRNA (guanosine(2251)-2'-O)-methyltransferase RlmB n=1 Tax=Oceanicoccus sp. KOV_DT_Chl TaxID=1904639 RepID=UPI000C7CE8B4|nr:23S rRNA (guanosine(2251)-2'-O)-methyltransferase RlmB [Oceanicoccus sp. KOV_DT_Chl]